MNTFIEIKEVSKSFGHKNILTSVSLSVQKGETIGIVGENGSGKSVLFKILCGFLQPDTGEVIIRGERLGKERDFPDNIGVFINSPGFVSLYSGFQNLKYLADIRGVIGEKEIRDAMYKVGLNPDDKTKVGAYSLGMKQKLGIAQAIMEDQEIVVLDEPFNALDYRTYGDIKEIIQELKKDGKTIFLISHNYTDIEQLCDRIYAIENTNLLSMTEEMVLQYKKANGEIRG